MDPEAPGRLWPHGGMAQIPTKTAFAIAFCERVADLRGARDFTQYRMAETLGVPLENYKKYEKRSCMPHYLIPKFANIVGVSIEYLFYGRGAVDKSGSGPRKRAVKRKATRFSVVPQP